jgi:tol-pal system protein YbgF
MKASFKTFASAKTGSLLVAGALFAVTLATPARAGFAQSADTNQLMSRINQLETQVQTLSRAYYRGETPAAGSMPDAGGGMDSGALSSFDGRLSALENQQRDMTGQLEKLNHDISVLQEKLDKMQADNDMRLRQLEGSAPAAAGGAAANGAPAGAKPAETDSTLYVDDKPADGQTLGTLSSSGASDPANNLYEAAFNDIRQAKYDTAADKFKRFLALYPSHKLAGNAQYWLGETYYARGDYAQSARLFAQGYQDYPNSPKAADSLLKMALSLENAGKKEDACLSFAQMKKQFPTAQGALIQRADQESKKLGCQ